MVRHPEEAALVSKLKLLNRLRFEEYGSVTITLGLSHTDKRRRLCMLVRSPPTARRLSSSLLLAQRGWAYSANHFYSSH